MAVYKKIQALRPAETGRWEARHRPGPQGSELPDTFGPAPAFYKTYSDFMWCGGGDTKGYSEYTELRQQLPEHTRGWPTMPSYAKEGTYFFISFAPTTLRRQQS